MIELTTVIEKGNTELFKVSQNTGEIHVREKLVATDKEVVTRLLEIFNNV